MNTNDAIHDLERALSAGTDPPNRDMLQKRAAMLSQFQTDPNLLNNCDWEFFDLIHRANRTYTELGGGLVGVAALLSTQMDQRLLLQSHRNFIAANHPFTPSQFKARKPGKRLRIGFIGADFFWQATSLLMLGMVEALNRADFEVFGYDFGGGEPSEYRTRTINAFDHFTDIREMDDATAAGRIYSDKVDVLIHLRGILQGRMGVMALRPSPIQAQYLYYPCTTGAWFIDYMVADAFTIPAGHERFYSERIARLPGCYQPNDSNRPMPGPSTRADFDLPKDAVVMANFGQPAKITPQMFDVWCRLLRGDPNRILWLLGFPEGPRQEANLRREAAIWDIAQDRIRFAPYGAYSLHLARIRCADLMLDTFPCGQHTGASDALWAGTPMLTVAGETFASRVAGSLLTDVGLGVFITDSLEAYAERADAMLRDPGLIARAKAHLDQGRARFDLFNPTLYAQRFGALVKEMVVAGPRIPLGGGG